MSLQANSLPGLPGVAPSQLPPGLPLHAQLAVPLENGASGTVVPTPAEPHTISTAAPSKRKKAGKGDLLSSELASRRQAAEARIAALESIRDAAESVPPTLTAPIASNTAEQRPLSSAARDVWYFISPVESKDNVPEGEIDAQVERDTAQQAEVPFDSLRHPQTPYLRCRPCLRRGVTKIWVNRPGGLTGGLRDHMERHHPISYYTKCREEGLDHIQYPEVPNGAQPEFSRAGLVHRLIDWIAIDDQALNVIENPEFRDLLLYCGQNTFNDCDIPHRDKLAAAAWSMYLLEKEKIDAEMKRARGRISLTSDLWTDINLRSFMSVTAHYINDAGEISDRLIAFRKVNGPHTGENIGQVLFNILIESGIANKIGCITLDNASNNNTLMQELAQAFKARRIEFNEKENRIRCFPHVVNLAVNAIVKNLPKASAAFRDLQDSNEPIDPLTEEYLQALESNPIEACRASVLACRSSGIRREGIRQTIIDGNASGRFRLPNGETYRVPVLELLRDTPTRWSSTYNMIKRYAIVEYAFRNRNAQIPIVSHRQYEALQDILSVLSVAHCAQELLSADKTPTLSLAFPIYESLVKAWELLQTKIPELRASIIAGIDKIREYVDRTQGATVHTLAMVINPSLKLEWIGGNWSPFDRLKAYEVVKEKMMSFQREAYEQTLEERRFDTSASTQAQNRGYLNVLTLSQSLRRASENISLGTPSPITMEDPDDIQTSPGHALPAITRGRLAPSPEEIRAHNNGAVEFELNRYISAGTIPVEAMGAIALTEYWRANQFTYPLLYRIAMDVLPVQASSVSSERVFSSSKLTCTSSRNRISTNTMEALQVLKHSLYRRRREVATPPTLDFVAHQFENLEIAD